MARKQFTTKQKKEHSLRMKAIWARKRVEKELKNNPLAKPVTQKMYVRVLHHQDGLQMDNYTLEADKWGQLLDLLHNNYLGVQVTEVLIQIK